MPPAIKRAKVHALLGQRLGHAGDALREKTENVRLRWECRRLLRRSFGTRRRSRQSDGSSCRVRHSFSGCAVARLLVVDLHYGTDGRDERRVCSQTVLRWTEDVGHLGIDLEQGHENYATLMIEVLTSEQKNSQCSQYQYWMMSKRSRCSE